MPKDVKQDPIKQLIQSNMLLQSKLADLVQSNNELVKQITAMVKFFHEAGERINVESEDEKLKPLFEKLNSLLDQIKTIVRGLLLVQKYIKTTGFPEEKMSPREFEF